MLIQNNQTRQISISNGLQEVQLDWQWPLWNSTTTPHVEKNRQGRRNKIPLRAFDKDLQIIHNEFSYGFVQRKSVGLALCSGQLRAYQVVQAVKSAHRLFVNRGLNSPSEKDSETLTDPAGRFPRSDRLPNGVVDRYVESTVCKSMKKTKKYILIIDDETSVRQVTAEILREANAHTLEAEDGLVGLQLFRQYVDQIALVLLDFSMPGLNGGQVLEQMWKIDASIPILFFSGYGQHEILHRALRTGIVGFLQKPYSINELLLAVRQNLKHD